MRSGGTDPSRRSDQGITAMTHTAIQEKLDGKPVDWLEHVTQEQYDAK